MKILHTIFTITLFALVVNLSAQNEWDIRFAQSSFDCSNNQVCYRLEVKNTSGADWTLGDQNYRLFFDGDLMTVASVTSLLPATHYGGANIDMNSKYTGVGQDAASPLNDIDDHLGFLDFSIVQTDKSNPSAAVQLNSTTYTPAAEICMDTDASVLSDPTGSVCLGLYHSRPLTAGSFTNQYTTISENDAPNSTVAAVGINYDDLNASDGADACPGSLCASEREWDIQMTQSNINCDANQVCYQLEVKNQSGTDWTLGDQNYRLFFDGDLMTVVSVTSLLPATHYGGANIDMNSKYTGVGQDAASPLNDIDDHLGFLDFNIIQIDKSNPPAAVQLTNGAFTPVAEICVDVDASVLSDATGNTCLAFYHSRPSTAGTFTNQYTTITENDAANSTTDSEGINYDDLNASDGADACPGATCMDPKEWNIQLTQSSIDCEADQICYQLEVQDNSGTDWTLGDQNYRLFFDGDLMTVVSVTSLLPGAYYSNANIDMNSKYTGVGQDAASPLNDIDDHLGFLDFNIIQTDKSNPSAAAQVNSNSFTAVAEICVDVDASVLSDATGNTCLAFYHSRPSTAGTFTNQYTTITENDDANTTTPTAGINYDDLNTLDGNDACPGGSCTEAKEWDIRLTRSSLDCAAGQACYQLEVQNNTGSDWTLGDQNYRLFFDGDLMTVVSVTSLLPATHYGGANIDMNSKYTGVGQDAASPLNDIDDHLGFLDFNIIQTDKSNPPAAVQLTTGAFTPVAEICVDVDASALTDITNSTCIVFYHSRPSTAGTFTNQYTTITENDDANSTTDACGVDYDDLNSDDGAIACDFSECRSVDIALDKQVDQLNPNAGDTVTFFIIVENEGLRPGTGVEVTDQLPSGIDYVSDDSQGSYDEVSGVWTIGNMAVGQIDTLQIRGRILMTGDYTNVAEITATNEQDSDSDPNSDSSSDDNNDGIPDDDEDAVTLLPNTNFDLALSKSLAPGQPVIVHLGEDIEYSIKVFNEGDIPARDVEVCDLIPAGMILSPNDNNNWTNVGASVQGDTAYHTVNQVLVPGDSVEIRILLRLLYSLPNRTIVNVAEIVGDKDADGNGVIDIDSEPDNNNLAEDDIEEEEVQFLDIDPTGYIYCDKTGKVVPGGTVSITGPNGIPNSEVLIFEDGSSGFYAWYAVGLQGVYTMTYTHPDGITFSTIRLPQTGPLDPTGMASPVVLGSDTLNMHLIDTTFANNPFYLTFDFEMGDPIILKNNIPVSCALIGSIVCLDDDGNEMDDGNEPPLANGKVLLYECGNTTTPLDSTLTNADGEYVLDGLPGGNYQLQFIPPSGYRYILSQSDTLTNGFTSCISINPGQCDSSKTVCFRLIEYDFGDLPDTSAGENEDDYQTLGTNSGPAHLIIGGLLLGASVDGEFDGQPSADALGDDADEDTFTIPASADWIPGGNFLLPFTYINTTGDTAFVKIWIDWNADGDFSEANEEIIDWNDANAPFPNMFSTTIPPNAQTDKNIGVRVRISLRDNMTPYGYIDSGEVEDYLIRLSCPTPVCLPVIIEKMN